MTTVPPTTPPPAEPPQPAWKRWLLDLLDNHWAAGGIGALLALGNFVVLHFLFDVRGFDGDPRPLKGTLIATSIVLGLGEVVVLGHLLGRRAGPPDLRTGTGKAVAVGWAAILAVALGLAVWERSGGFDDRFRRQQSIAERERQARQADAQQTPSPAPSAGPPPADAGTPADGPAVTDADRTDRAIARLRERAAARAAGTRPASPRQASSRPAGTRASTYPPSQDPAANR